MMIGTWVLVVCQRSISTASTINLLKHLPTATQYCNIQPAINVFSTKLFHINTNILESKSFVFHVLYP